MRRYRPTLLLLAAVFVACGSRQETVLETLPTDRPGPATVDAAVSTSVPVEAGVPTPAHDAGDSSVPVPESGVPSEAGPLAEIDAGGSLMACGGIIGTICASPEWCDYPDASACGVSDERGVCRARPASCGSDCPGVCGCDGKKYCNACLAHAAGRDDSTLKMCN